MKDYLTDSELIDIQKAVEKLTLEVWTLRILCPAGWVAATLLAYQLWAT